MRIKRGVVLLVIRMTAMGATLAAATAAVPANHLQASDYASVHNVKTDLVITSAATPDVYYDF